MYRLLPVTTVEYMFFPSSHGTFTKKHHALDHKAHLNKFESSLKVQWN
jgi:hypothetical protein